MCGMYESGQTDAAVLERNSSGTDPVGDWGTVFSSSPSALITGI